GGPLNSTALAQLEHGNTGDYADFVEQSGIAGAGWRDALARHPAHTQDRWHARLYFARPLLRVTLALLWLVSGLAGLFALRDWAPRLAGLLGIGGPPALVMLIAACACDIVIAALVLARWRPPVLAGIQVVVIAVYTLAGTAMEPGLWAAPLGPLLKNLPIVAAALALGAIEDER
ncbi:MAG TPA: DoxX-like family protein, partial [Gemmatimonadaceae bacterium]|nr:DoxX-like family protein [Gemmatimonadaceae bacterium]